KLPSPVDARAKLTRFLGLAFVVLGILVAGLGAILSAHVPLLIAGGRLAVVGAIVVSVARSMRLRTARGGSQTCVNAAAMPPAAAVHHDLEEPAREELAEHEAVLAATGR